MKILILGGTGMLGHRLWLNLGKQHETWVTVRNSNKAFPEHNEFCLDRVISGIDGNRMDTLLEAFSIVQPDIVINCIGLIKQLPISEKPIPAIAINAALPHQIALACKAAGARMIHVSTDCVFSGREGNYKESDQSNAEDLYGRSKFLGEVSDPHTITLRTSIIGRELKTHYGLIDWFLRQSGEVKGYKRAIYSGFTTDELSSIILNYVIPNTELHGLYHVSSNPICKYDLLQLTNRIFEKDINIIPDEEVVCDRSLNSDRFRSKSGYKPPSWEQMIMSMCKNSDLYDNHAS